MDKATQIKIYKAIDASSIPDMLKVLYMFASATETLSQHTNQRIKSVFLMHGQKAKENGLLTGINDYCKSVRLATTQFFDSIEPKINGATFGSIYDKERHEETIEAATGAYDGFEADALELIRLVLLYVDRTYKSNENFAKVFKTLRCMPPGGLFSDNEIARFKQK